MKRKLTLHGPEDRIVYRTTLLGFLQGGKPDAQGGRSRDSLATLTRIKRTLFAAGELIEDMPLQAGPDDVEDLKRLNDPEVLIYKAGRGIRLKDGEQVIELSQADLDRIEKHVTGTNWTVLQSEDASEALDRLSASEQIKD